MTALTPSIYRPVIESMFRIVSKDGVAVDFRLNGVQAILDAGWSRRNIVPKARQPGISSYVIARFVAKCLTQDNRTCVIVSHEAEATQRLLGRADYILSNLKGGVKPELGRRSRNEIFFKKTNSTIFIGTAGSRSFGHGDTITDLHLSEMSRYPDPDSIVSGTFPAAERGEITIESTGNGVGNLFHEYCTQAREGFGFRLFLFTWPQVPEYNIPFESPAAREAFRLALTPELEEPELLAKGLSLEQLQWRRETLTINFRRDLRAFKEAYPADFDECFQSKGFGFFNRVHYEPTERWAQESAALHVLDGHPRDGATYVIGADPAGGVGADNSVAQVFCLETAEQVAEFASSTIEPPAFADAIATLGKRFNGAYVNVERNNHGGTVLARLLDSYPLELLHRGSHGEQSTQVILSRLSHYGTVVTPSNRGLILGTARELIAEHFTVHSPLLYTELRTFVEKDGKAEADVGCKDDRVFGCVHALIVVEKAGYMGTAQRYLPPVQAEPDPFSFEALFRDFGSEREVFGTPERYYH